MYTPKTYLLSMLETYEQLTDQQIKEMLLRWAKKERKGKTNAEIRERGLTIFHQEDAAQIIETALNENLVSIIENTEITQKMILSNEGKLTLAIFLTNNFSEAYKEYAQKFDNLLEIASEPPYSKLKVMKFFHANANPETIVSGKFQKEKSQNLSVDYHKNLIRDVAGHKDIEEDDYIFHLTPRLYVPRDLMGSRVSIEIMGLDEPVNLMVTTPYPNKHYYIAGMKKGRRNTASGFYPIICKREDFPLIKEITFHWVINNDIRIDHHLEIEFQFTNLYGHLFSTEQQFTRSIAAIDNFTLNTSIERESYHNRNAKVIVHDIYNHFEIQEKVKLTNFPMELHQISKPGKYFRDWYRKWDAE